MTRVKNVVEFWALKRGKEMELTPKGRDNKLNEKFEIGIALVWPNSNPLTIRRQKCGYHVTVE